MPQLSFPPPVRYEARRAPEPRTIHPKRPDVRSPPFGQDQLLALPASVMEAPDASFTARAD